VGIAVNDLVIFFLMCSVMFTLAEYLLLPVRDSVIKICLKGGYLRIETFIVVSGKWSSFGEEVRGNMSEEPCNNWQYEID